MPTALGVVAAHRTAPAAGDALPVTAGLQGWWDADDDSTFTYSSGLVVSQWRDKSGANRHLNQGTVANQPTRNGIQNGKTTITFDGGDALASAAFTVASPFTVFVALKHNVTTINPEQVIFSSADGATSLNWSVAYYQMRASHAGAGFAAPGGLTSTGHTRCVVFDGASSQAYLGGDSMTTGEVGTAALTSGVRIGSTTTDTGLNGEMYEAILYDRVLSAAERNQVEQYLSTKWSTPPPPGWTPANLSNLVTWIDASDTSSINETAGAVNQINDLSGNGHHFASGPTKPTTGTTTINGKNVLNFVSETRLTLDAGTDTLDLDTYTILFIAQITPTVSRMVSLATNASTAANVDIGYGAILAATSGPYAAHPNLQPYREPGGGPYLGIPPSVLARLRTSKEGTSWTVGVNATESTSVGESALDLVRYIHIGANPVYPLNGFVGTLCEFVVCDGALSAADLTEWKNYVDYKWYGMGGGGTGGGATFTIPGSIVDDGTVEVGAEINAWLQTVPNDAVVEFAAGATYWTEETLFCANRYDMVFEGNGATFEQHTNGDDTTPIPGHDHMWPRERAFWLIDGGGNLEFRNFNFEGGNPVNTSGLYVGYSPYMGQGYEEQHAFAVNGVQGIQIHDNTATRTYGDFACFGMDARDGEVIDNTATCLGRQGVAIVYASDILIQGNTLDHIARSAFDVEPIVEAWECRRITIDDNDVSNFINVFIANLGAGGNVSDLTISNNRLTGLGTTITVSAGYPASATRRHNYTIINNSATGTNAGPIGMLRFVRVDNILIEGNYQGIGGRYPEDGSVYSGYWSTFDDCNNVAVRNNIAYEAERLDITTFGVQIVAGPGAGSVVHCGNITSTTGTGPPVDGVCP